MQVLQQSAEWGAFGHLGKGIHILGEALATITVLAVRSGDIGVGVVNVAGEEDAGVYLAPVSPHLLAVLAAGVEISDLISTKHVVHILGQLGLKRGHHHELLAHEDLGKQFVCAGEDHGLFLEVLYMGALGQELGHIAYLMAGLLGETVAGAGQNGGAHEHGHVGEILDKFGHQSEVLRAVVLGGDMNLQKSNIDIAQVVVVTLWRVADENFTLRVVMFQPIFKGSTYEATSDNSNINHCC